MTCTARHESAITCTAPQTKQATQSASHTDAVGFHVEHARAEICADAAEQVDEAFMWNGIA